MRVGGGPLLLAVAIVALASRLAAADDGAATLRDLLRTAYDHAKTPGNFREMPWGFESFRFFARMKTRLPDERGPVDRRGDSYWPAWADDGNDAIRGGVYKFGDGRTPDRKLLWQQALCVEAFLDAVQVTGDERYREVVRRTLGFALRDLPLSAGGFAAADVAPDPAHKTAVDAYHSWTEEQLAESLRVDLGERTAIAVRLLVHRFGPEPLGLSRATGFLVPPEPRPDHDLGASAAACGLSLEAAAALIAHARVLLIAAQDQRPRPPRDETLIPSYNWLLVAALARAYAVLGDDAYRAAAEAAAEFLGSRAINSSDRIAAIHATLALHQATGAMPWLAWAVAEQDRLDEKFWDAAAAGYRTDQSAPHELSLSGLASLNLLRLGEITGDDRYRERALALMTTPNHALKVGNEWQPDLLCALDQSLGPVPHLLLVGDQGTAAGIRALLAAANRSYQPRLVIVTMTGEPEQAELRKRFPAMIPSPMIGGKATAYLCVGMTCNRPTTDPAELERQLAAIVYRW